MPKIIKWEPGVATLDGDAKIRTAPTLVEGSEWFVTGPGGASVSTFVGWTEGDSYGGSNLWGVYFIPGAGKWAFTHKVNVQKVTPMAGGFTQEQLDAAKSAAVNKAIADFNTRLMGWINQRPTR